MFKLNYYTALTVKSQVELEFFFPIRALLP